MRKRKGFTLVELLAVIAILAILILLALPAVLRMFRNARMQSFENEVKSIYRQAQNQIISDSLNLDAGGEKVYASDITTNTATQGNLELQGGNNLKYCVLVDNSGNIKKLYVSNGTYQFMSEDLEELSNIENINIEDISGSDTIMGMDSCMPVLADSTILNYTISNNQVTINGFADNLTYKPRNISIPSSIEGYPVTTIKNSAFSNGDLIGVIIPDSVTSIGKAAFYGNKLVNLTIPNSNLTIGYAAFNDNQLPDDQAFIYKRTSSGIDYTNIVSYGGINKNVIIPDGVITIGRQSFQQCKLTTLIIPNTVTTIEQSAFLRNHLTSVSLGNRVATIGKFAFEYNKLTSISIPESVTTIENQAFHDNNLTNLVIPSSVTNVGQLAFAFNKISNLVIPDSLISIGTGAFNNNELPDSQAFLYRRTSSGIDYTTIFGYGGLNKEVVIPSGVVTIAGGSFKYNSINSVRISSNVNSIESNAFSENELLSVTIEGKSSSTEFTTYNPGWGWAGNVTCVKNNTTNVTNGCITWNENN